MELVDVEHLFGGERIVFYFLAEKRVDFRELVKDLAREFQHAHRDAADRRPRRGQAAGRLRRLRQAGLLQHAHGRHAAGVDADGQAAEIDARPVEDLGPLRPAEVLPALRAGRLRGVPEASCRRVGPRVVTAKGQGRVLAQEILARKLLVEFEDGRRLPVAAAEILTRLGN